MAFKTPKMIAQVRACLKYFRILYILDAATGRVTNHVRTADERRQRQNQDRIELRKKKRTVKLELENERLRLAEQRGFERGIEEAKRRML